VTEDRFPGAGLTTLTLEEANGRFAAVLLDSVLARFSVVLTTPGFVGFDMFNPALRDDILLDTPLSVGRFLISPSSDRTVSVSESAVVDPVVRVVNRGLVGGLLIVLPAVLARVDVRAAEEFAAVAEVFVGPVARLVTGLVAAAVVVVFASLAEALERSVAGVARPVFSLCSILVVTAVAHP